MRTIHLKTVAIAVFAVVGAFWFERCYGESREEIAKELEERNMAEKLQKELEAANKVTGLIDDERNSMQVISAELVNYLTESEKSPYRWKVLHRAKNRFNGEVQKLKPEVFEDVFQSARKLYNGLRGTSCWNAETFGDNALYWLTPTNSEGIVHQASNKWLCYDFQCENILFKTDHLRNNPESKPFYNHKVWVNFYLSYGSFSRDFSIGNRIVEYSNGNYANIPDSKIDTQRMKATDVIKLKLCKGEEDDWWYDVDLPRTTFEFRPGWDMIEAELAYGSKRDVYPNDVFFIVRLDNSKVTGGPREAFEQALSRAKEHEAKINEKRVKAVKEAESKRKRNLGKGD